MEGPMTRSERKALKRIAKRLVTQGPDHKNNICEYYNIMAKAAAEEFTEDNRPTLNAFLRRCFNIGEKKC